MFEQIGFKNFVNREQTGEYADIEFDTYVNNKGKEELLGVTATLHYYGAGSGDPLILVHGIGQSSYTWRSVFSPLSESFKVLAPDLPGHGFSTKPEISYSIEDFALSIEAFLNTKKIVAANFCAFGEAAAYVLDFAIHNRERTKGLVLISPVMAGGAGLSKNRGMPSVFGSTAARMKVTPPIMKSVLEDCYFDRTLVTDDVVMEYLNGVSDKDFKIISRMCVNNFADDNVLSNLGLIRSPILVLVGNDDKITGGRESDFLNLGFENGSFLNIRNCGYLVQEEKPERVCDAIKKFLGAA